jgi:hypothetical protein
MLCPASADETKITTREVVLDFKSDCHDIIKWSVFNSSKYNLRKEREEVRSTVRSNSPLIIDDDAFATLDEFKEHYL